MPSESVAWYQHFGYNFKRRKLSGAYSTPASHPVFWGPWQWYSRVQWRIYGAGDHMVKTAFIITGFWSRRQHPSNHFWFLRYLICSKLTHCRISSLSFEKCIVLHKSTTTIKIQNSSIVCKSSLVPLCSQPFPPSQVPATTGSVFCPFRYFLISRMYQ